MLTHWPRGTSIDIQAESIDIPDYWGCCKMRVIGVLHGNTKRCVAQSSRITSQNLGGQCVKIDNCNQSLNGITNKLALKLRLAAI